MAAIPASFANATPNFDGIGYTGLVPPDPVGDVGPNHYIQAVNAQFQIFDKQGQSLAGPLDINQLWIDANAGEICQANNSGDPYVIYDHLADRWLITQIAVPNGFDSPPTAQCVAISQTADPVAGGWFLYEFVFNFYHDYPKIGLWPDGYYLSSERGFSEGMLNAVVFDRASMLKGNPANFQAFTSPPPALIWLPSDLDGPPPPPGTPNFYARHVDGDLWGGVDRIDIMAFTVDWADPANSSFAPLPSLPAAAFDSDLCNGTDLFNDCVPQPGTETLLETLPHWAMGPLQYRNFGDRETLVFNHTVDADGKDHAAIRWYELRRPPGGAWSIFQQATHSPDAGNPGFGDDVHRWMGSIAMDKAGNIALGYSISDGSTVFPSIAYVGRLATDPLGLTPQGAPPKGEIMLFNGGNSQIINENRWGDYSAMRVDPVDGCTFWYTQGYVAEGEPFGGDNGGAWATRIGAFRFPSCNQADLSIVQSGSLDSIHAGEELSYTITVTNSGPDTAFEVTVTDVLPSEVTYLSDTSPNGCDLNTSNQPTLTCPLGDIPPEANVIFEVRVAVPSDAVVNQSSGTTVITNIASVAAGTSEDPEKSNNSVAVDTVVEELANLKVTKDCKPDEPLSAGKTGTCTMTVENLGPSDARNVMLMDTYLSNDTFKFGDIKTTQGECEASPNPQKRSGEVTCSLGSIPAAPSADSHVTVTAKVKSDEDGNINSMAFVDSDTPDPNPANNKSEDFITVNRRER
jgi:uncharacterized repeat protein (TIGR01451 family)